ncbi:MAG: hypothetical protein SVQ76_01685 [Candidatus Nanohaloarchaea archaeon]|nr:hypothetical protein [Candidatus Nanohaloarchaea archaeon]
MSDLLDPATSYISLIGLITVAAVVLGTLFGPSLGMLPSVVVIALLGFVVGLYTDREGVEMFGTLVLASFLALAAISFLEPGYFTGLAIFLLSVIVGLKTERR